MAAAKGVRKTIARGNGRGHGAGKVWGRMMGALAAVLSLVALLGTVARELPGEVAAVPYLPIVVSFTPWFALIALVALVLSLVSKRWTTALVMVLCLAAQAWWQYPFFSPSATLPEGAAHAMSTASPNPIDAYARVMTMNVYKGNADAARVVELVRDERVEVLALQETSADFVARLERAGIKQYLPYSKVSSSDGVFGNGLWSTTPLGDPVDDEVHSSASFMPGATVRFNDGKTPIRFVSVHTTAPVPGYWRLWRKSIDELGMMRGRTDARYVFMGDFNATYDHAPFREFLGTRFTDAARQSGHGFTFTWPADKSPLPRFAGIDHIVTDQGIVAGRMEVRQVAGSDHAALLATIAIS
ncbi:endonuclease/exonuclease/phosphatase family protein [Bifidobacterium vespertilionis]|uniref:Endonuclease/exonuclease/phosphatase family protein n=1 Tax=Bifidobacterium vespertilionis TaxID=2562524 RepID=A0A5J5DUH4_9BIFI|nr:endonuclease/exonuclease/phosphatase family protein [Bifidobacterium vespertilionis]KAA8823449.1 endonuclease/exonuclease/phosphatase family protein [Bifidobacterium vespertilionis]